MWKKKKKKTSLFSASKYLLVDISFFSHCKIYWRGSDPNTISAYLHKLSGLRQGRAGRRGHRLNLYEEFGIWSGVGKMNEVFNCIDDKEEQEEDANKASWIKDNISCYFHLVNPFPKNLVQNFLAPTFLRNVTVWEFAQWRMPSLVCIFREVCMIHLVKGWGIKVFS